MELTDENQEHLFRLIKKQLTDSRCYHPKESRKSMELAYKLLDQKLYNKANEIYKNYFNKNYSIN